MFLDTLATDKGDWLQTCISLPYVGEAPGYAETLRTILSASGVVPSLNLAFRIGVSAARRLQRTLILVAPTTSERSLRRFVASFSRLELLVPGSIELAADASSFDAMLGAFPAQHSRIVASGFRRGNVWFGADFRLISHLGRLLEEALLQGLELYYQLNMRPYSGDAQVLRSVERNYLAARDLPGARPALLRLQRRLADRLASASCLVEEFAGVEGEGGKAWLESALDRVFAEANAEFGFGNPGFCFEDQSEILAAGLHTSWWNQPSPDEVCVTAADSTEVATIVSWQPDTLLAKALVLSPVPGASDFEPPPRLSGPVPYAGSGTYVFISYRHSDLPALMPALNELQASGIRYWYDAGIQASTEWLHVLEERIENAALIVVFLSQSAVDSKYVRRELLMADSLNKPILTLLVGKPELRYGLKLLLPQYQMIDFHAQPAAVAVQQALGAARGTHA